MRSWRLALAPMVVAGLATSMIHLADLVDRPRGQPVYWPTFVIPLVAMLVSGMVRLVRGPA